MSSKKGFVYILSNKTRTVLYTGVTSSLIFRVQKHRKGEGCYFSRKYKTRVLLYYEKYQSIQRAIEREKQLKNWKREWKLELIKKVNPKLRDIWEETVKDFND
jgi:putative endonuclease